jgi:hypothetical protein
MWVAGLVVVILTTLYVLWYSPTIYYRGAAWSRAYSACVESHPRADTLGDLLLTRIECHNRAVREMKQR